MDKQQSGKLSSSGKIARALLMIFILQFVGFSSTKAQLDFLDNYKKYSIYIVQEEPARIQPSYSRHPFSLRTVIPPNLNFKCPDGQQRDRNGDCHVVQPR